MATLGAITSTQLVPKVLTGSTTYDPASLANSATANTTVTVTGAVAGNFSVASFTSFDTGKTFGLYSFVESNDTVRVVFQNLSGLIDDLASGTLSAMVIAPTAFGALTSASQLPVYLTNTVTYDPPSILNNTVTTTTISVPGCVQGDYPVVGFDQLTVANWLIGGNIADNDVVRVYLKNNTGGTVDLPSGNLKAFVIKTPTTYSSSLSSSTNWNTVLQGSGTWDPASLSDGGIGTVPETVTGAVIGDPALMAFNQVTGAWQLAPICVATNSVRCILVNRTGGTVDPASGTAKAMVLQT